MDARKIDTSGCAACLEASAGERGISRGTVAFLAVAVGILVVNLTAPQTLVGVIAPELGIPEQRAGFIGTASLLGYAAGLFLLVPLSDLLENRGLVLAILGVAVISAFAASVAGEPLPFLALLFVLGAASSAIQVLVPIAASMARPEERGRVVGDVMSGLMVGILLSRPLASLIADTFGWRAFYVINGGTITLLMLVMLIRLPARRPEARSNYLVLMASLASLLRHQPVLRRRSLTAALGLAAFTVFWTAVALRLAQAPFDFDQRHVAVFALVGASGAFVAPLAGRAGDRGLTRPLTVAAHVATVLGFGIAAVADALVGALWPALVALGVAAVVIDVGVILDQTLGRRAVNLLAPEARGRLNALFVGLFFVGGAFGSMAAGYAWVRGGWSLVCATGAGFGILALLSDLTERVRSRNRAEVPSA